MITYFFFLDIPNENLQDFYEQDYTRTRIGNYTSIPSIVNVIVTFYNFYIFNNPLSVHINNELLN
jgi:hypothetical protein